MELTVATMTQSSCNSAGEIGAIVVGREVKTIEKKNNQGQFAKMLIRFAESGPSPAGFWGTLTGKDVRTLETSAKHYEIGKAGTLKTIQLIEDRFLVGKVVNLNVSIKPGTRATTWTPMSDTSAFMASPTAWPEPNGSIDSFTNVTTVTHVSVLAVVVSLSEA